MLKSPVCVDANVIIALVTAEHFSRGALALWQEWLTNGYQPCAPLLLRYEITSALHRKALDGRMSHEDAGQALAKALACDIRFLDPVDIHVRAFDLAALLKRTATYDSHYLALAEHLDCRFWTADERLYNAAKDQFPRIRWLGDYPAETR
jgi:predicted nucleic acid-binding protein